MPLLLALICAVLVFGLILWWPLRSDVADRASLGASLLTSGVISLAFFFLQDQNEKSQRQVSDREALRVTLGTQRDLRSADLSDRDLGRFDLARKDLSGADLSSAGLTGGRLRDASLVGARLVDARLDNADLTGAKLTGALMNGIDLHEARMMGARLENAALGTTDQGRRANLAGAYLVDAHLQGACLAHADLRKAVLGGADLRGAVLTGADLRGAVLVRDGLAANFDQAGLTDVKVDTANRARLPAPTPPAAQPVPVPADARSDDIVEVSDGDTVRLRGLGWVRVIGVDAPDPTDRVGKQARDFLVATIRRARSVRYRLGQQRVETRQGTVGRSRAYVWLADGRFLNGALLDDGYAQRQRRQPEDRRYVQPLEDAEARAKAGGRRIWSTCRKD